MHIHHRITNVLIGLTLLLAALMPQPAKGQSSDPTANPAVSTGAASSSAAAPLDPGFLMLKDINPGADNGLMYSSTSQGVVALGNKVFFFANDGVHGFEPWITDGTPGGTSMIKDTNPGAGDVYRYDDYYIAKPALWKGKVYFAGFGPGPDGTPVPQLWVSDGTAAGTQPVTNANHPIRGFKAGTLGIMFSERSNGQTRIWWTDGTAQKTVQVYLENSTSYVDYIEYKGAAFIINPNGEMWKVDPNTVQATLVNAYGIIQFIGIANNLLFFARQDFVTYDLIRLWQTEGTSQSFVQVTQSGYFTGPILATPNVLYFTIRSDSGSKNLYKTSGAASGITPLTNDALEMSSGIYQAGGLLYFTRGTYGSLALPYRSDGTAAGTWPICATCMHYTLDEPGFVSIGGKIIYKAIDGQGNELWISDGTDDGTHRMADINPGSGASDPKNLLAMNGFMFFTASDGVHGMEPWVYWPSASRLVTHHDSAEAGTARATNINVLANDAQLDGVAFWLADIDTNSIMSGTITRDENGTPGYPYDDRVVYTSAPGYVGPDEFSYTIQDNGGRVTTGRVTVNVIQMNQPPSDITLAYANGVFPPEHAPAGTLVGTLTVTDQDPGDSHTCQMTTPGVPFAIQGMQVLTTAALNYEAASSYEVTIRCTDSYGLTLDKSFTIGVQNVNEPPVVTSPLAFSVVEDGTQDYTLTWTDPENSPAIWPELHENPSHGTVSLPDSHTIRYQPEANYVGTDTLAFDLADYGCTCGTVKVPVTLTITIQPGNDDPPFMTPVNLVLVPNLTATRTMALTGIAAGPYEDGPATITAKASDPVTGSPTAAITDLTVNYTEGSTGTLTFTFHPEVADSATITVTLDDGVNKSTYPFPVQTTDVPPLFLPLVGR